MAVQKMNVCCCNGRWLSGKRKFAMLLAVCALAALVFARSGPSPNWLPNNLRETAAVVNGPNTPWLRPPVLIEDPQVAKSPGREEEDQPEASPAEESAPPASSEQCHDVMGSMTQGRWERLPMTSSDVLKMNAFHKHVREVEHGMPPGLQRDDGLCGNLSFADKGVAHHGPHPWRFRAVCDAEGPTPCCFQHRCVNRSPQDCACADCYDMRNPLHGEFARWRPHEEGCRLEEMSVDQICRVLNNATLFFLGDSLVRHIYTALLMMVRGNVTGAFKDNIPKDLRSNCSGVYMFTEKHCRHWVDNDVRVCPGQATHLRLRYRPYNSDVQGDLSPLFNTSRSLAVMGMGFHGNFNASVTFRKVVQPVLSLQKKARWPQLVWATTHHWGVLKNPNQPRQSLHNVSRFNERMKDYLRPFGPDQVAVFDAFNMTDSVVESFDGAHYGYGVNKVKVLILLNFIKELQAKNRW